MFVAKLRAGDPIGTEVAEAVAQLAPVARACVLGYLQAQGMGRHQPKEVNALGARTLDALSTLFGKRRWLMGDEPCGTDAALTGMLATLLSAALAFA